MKKTLLLISVTVLLSIGISAQAQGTWKTTGTETAISASTAITTGITGLTCMHSDAATIVGKTDAGATSVTYNGVTWANESYVQGSTNGMYFAFRATKNGILDIPVKMGSAKKTFILQLTDACPDNADLAALTSAIGTGDGIIGTPAYFTTPSVYDTYHATSGTWDGTVAIQSTGANVYLVMSFPVVANKTYVVGVLGSKLMLKGINYTVTTAVKEFPSSKGVSFNGVQVLNERGLKIELYNVLGKLITRSSTTISTSNLPKGVYVVRVEGSDSSLKFSK